MQHYSANQPAYRLFKSPNNVPRLFNSPIATEELIISDQKANTPQHAFEKLHKQFNSDVVSIIIPTHNCGKFIDDCIQSVLQQSWTKLEIIIINDGSIDDTKERVDQYLESSNQIQLINCEQSQGASHARNIGIERATGEFIFFLDADDWLHPTAIESLLASAKRASADLVIGGHLQVRQNINTMYFGYQKETDFNAAQLLDYAKKYLARPYKEVMLVHCWGRLYRHHIIDAKKICFNEQLTQLEDLHFNFQYLQHVNALTFIPNGFYYHRISNQHRSMSSQMGFEKNSPASAKLAFDQVSAFLTTHHQVQVDEAEALIRQGIANMLLVSIIRLCRNFMKTPNYSLYSKIKSILKSSIFQQNLSQIRPQKEEATLLYWSCRTKVTFLVLCAGILRVMATQNLKWK